MGCWTKVTVVNPEYPEDDEYCVEGEVPDVISHNCILTGVEREVLQFEDSLMKEIQHRPMQPFPDMYNRVR